MRIPDEGQMASPWTSCTCLHINPPLSSSAHSMLRAQLTNSPRILLDVTVELQQLHRVTASVMPDWSWMSYTVLEVLIAVASCLGNVLVVCAVCVRIRDSLREPTFCFLVSLAVADFLVGAAAVPLAVLLDGWVRLTPDLCLLLSCVVLVLTQASVLSLLCVAVDRYLRVHAPLR